MLVTVWATGGSVPAFAGNHFTLGVLAFRPLPETQEKWQPLADYLNETVAELTLELRVASATFDLPHNGEIANQLGIYGFTVPADYRPVARLLRDLRLPPFDQSPAFTVRDAWERWQSQFLFALLAVLLLLLLISAMVRGRRRVEQEQAYTLKLLASLGEGVYGSDQNGRCIFINDVAQTLLGFTSEEVIGHKQHQLFHYHTPDGRDYPETNCPICLTTHDGRVRRLEEWFFRKDGSGFPVELVVTPLREKGDIKGAIVAFQDISQRKEAEQLAARQSEELARSNADLEQFAYAVSHDLRQPLRMVNGYLQLLERRMGDRLVEKETEFMFYATDGARRMDEMIVALLNFSRVGRTSEPMMTMNGRDSLDEALNFLALDIEQAEAAIKVDGHWPEVVASRDELTRLFQNLIGNAIKYVPADISPEVVVDSAMADDRWRVEIRDNGIGIDQGQQSRLFKVFSRLQLRQHFDGTGIGLALCRRIVEHHHGAIGVESAGEGLGSTFWFEIPVNRTQD